MNRHYILAKGASNDLKDIIRHTKEQWGEAQCLAYAHGAVRKTLYFLSATPECATGHSGEFHEHMDIMARLRSRLS